MSAARVLDTDAELERRIEAAKLMAMGGRTPAARQAAWDELKALVAQRSPQQIERMERDRGLRP